LTAVQMPLLVEPIHPPEIVADAFPSSPSSPPPFHEGALDVTSEKSLSAANVRLVFRIWVFLFALVGAQMGWVLRPFIGHPHVAFSFFRPRSSNFFEGVFNAL